MDTYYSTYGHETLDYICWRHYVNNDLLEQNTSEFNHALFNSFLKSADAEDNGINGIIEKVLAANPGIADTLILPANLKICLPHIEETAIDADLKDLWD